MCYYAKLGHSASKGVDISTGILKIWVHWGPAQLSLATGVCLTTYKHTPPHAGYHDKSDCCWSYSTSERTGNPPKKTGFLTSHLSRSLKATTTDRDRSDTYEFLLMFRTNHGLTLYQFQDRTRHWQKRQIFLNTHLFNAPADGFPLELCNSG